MSFKTMYQKLIKILMAPIKAVKFVYELIVKAIGYIYQACDVVISNLIKWNRSIVQGLKEKNKGTREYRIARMFMAITVFFLIMFIVIIIAVESVFFVPVGGGAVVTRFGAYQRDVGMGLHFRIPFVERYYVVRTGFIKEETFGFIQVKPPTRVQRAPAENLQFERQYEQELLQREADNEVFSQKGNIISGLEQGQRLTHDYLRDMASAPRPLTIQEAQNILQANQEQRQQRIEQGVSDNGRLVLDRESRLITRNLSLIRLTWSIQYQIINMREYLFNSRDVQENIRDLSLSGMSEIIGRFNYESVMTVDRQKIENDVLDYMQNRINNLKLGIKITQVIVIDALPVPEVQFAFDEVNKAAQDKEKLIYEAQRIYQTTIPEAKGKAAEIRAVARAYAIEVMNKADGQAGQFGQILVEYKKWPAITNDRLYIEALGGLLSNAPTIIVDPKIQGLLPIFNMNGWQKLRNTLLPGQPTFSVPTTTTNTMQTPTPKTSPAQATTGETGMEQQTSMTTEQPQTQVQSQAQTQTRPQTQQSPSSHTSNQSTSTVNQQQGGP